MKRIAKDFQLDPLKAGELHLKRMFKLMNRTGQLGRQGVKGPAERSEKRITKTPGANSRPKM